MKTISNIGYLRKNEKGFYLRIQNKFFFIDRACKNTLSEGLCEYRFTKHFDKYGFVFAIMHETGLIDDMIVEGKINLDNIEICQRLFNKMDIWKLKEKDGDLSSGVWYTLVDGEVCVVDSSVIWDFINVDLNPQIEDFSGLKFEIAKKNEGVLNDEQVISLLIPAIFCFGWSEKILVSKGNNFVKVCFKNGTNTYYGLVNGKFSHSNYCYNYFEDARDIRKDVEEFILSRHIRLYGFDSFKKPPLVTERFYFNEKDYVKRTFINGDFYTDEIYESNKQKLEDSAREFEAEKKRIAKQLAGSKSLVDTMSKLNTKPIQLGIKSWSF